MKRIDHVGLQVKDIDVSIRFYTEIIGLELKDRVQAYGIEAAFLGYGFENEAELELISGFKDGLPSEGIVHHVALSSSDIQAEWDKLKHNGVEFISQEIAIMPSGIKYFFVYGPEKEWIEFLQRPNK
jgi:lactoylglutathione lyase